MKENIIKERRIGRFLVSDILLERISNTNLKKMFSNFVIVKAEYLYASKNFEYIAYSKLFEKVNPSNYYNDYQIIIDGNGNVKAEKSNSLQ